jgi:hypothetical protein
METDQLYFFPNTNSIDGPCATLEHTNRQE